MAVTVHIDVSHVLSALEEAISYSETELMSALEAGAKVIQAEAKRRAPVRKSEDEDEETGKKRKKQKKSSAKKGQKTGGQLKKSIVTSCRMEGGEAVATVGTNVHYAVHVEYGHRTGCAKNKVRRKPIRWITGRYFLKGAFDSQKDRAVRLICARLTQKKGGTHE